MFNRAPCVCSWLRLSAKLAKSVAGAAGEVVQRLRAELDDFMQHVPLVVALRNPGLRERHWQKLSAAAGIAITADSSFSLSVALQIRLNDHMKLVDEISEFASKEHSLERTLEKMSVRAPLKPNVSLRRKIGSLMDYWADCCAHGTSPPSDADTLQVALESHLATPQAGLRASDAHALLSASALSDRELCKHLNVAP